MFVFESGGNTDSFKEYMKIFLAFFKQINVLVSNVHDNEQVIC